LIAYTESTPLKRSPNICHRWLHLCQIWCQYVHEELLWKWVNITIFIYLFICLSIYLF